MPGTVAHLEPEGWLSNAGTDAQYAPEYSAQAEGILLEIITISLFAYAQTMAKILALI
jgi:hypothetical protein